MKPLINLGWNPKFSNDEMFRESYDWFINNFDSIKLDDKTSDHRKPVKEAILKIIRWVS